VYKIKRRMLTVTIRFVTPDLVRVLFTNDHMKDHRKSKDKKEKISERGSNATLLYRQYHQQCKVIKTKK
jgi:hypothetical protein